MNMTNNAMITTTNTNFCQQCGNLLDYHFYVIDGQNVCPFCWHAKQGAVAGQIQPIPFVFHLTFKEPMLETTRLQAIETRLVNLWRKCKSAKQRKVYEEALGYVPDNA